MELQEEKNFVLRCEKDLPKMLMVVLNGLIGQLVVLDQQEKRN